jgi:hydroxyacylglutathione hydrolase
MQRMYLKPQQADFLAGSRELAKPTGAELFLSAEGGKDWQYDFLP